MSLQLKLHRKQFICLDHCCHEVPNWNSSLPEIHKMRMMLTCNRLLLGLLTSSKLLYLLLAIYRLLDWKLVYRDGNAGNIAVRSSKWAEVGIGGVISAKKRAATLLLTRRKFHHLEKSSSLIIIQLNIKFISLYF